MLSYMHNILITIQSIRAEANATALFLCPKG